MVKIHLEDGSVIELENDYHYIASDGNMVPAIANTSVSSSLTINGNGKVIDGSSQSWLLIISGMNRVVLKNIIFKNAWGDNSVFIENTRYVEFDDCTFMDNDAYYGGALYIADCTESLFANCKFIDNVGYFGGVLDMADVGKTSFVGCEFINNMALDDEGNYHTGGALHIQNASTYLSGCKFAGNSASHGGAIYLINSTGVSVIDCDFSNNTASATGGAIYLDVGKNAQVNKCNFKNNSAHYGGGMYIGNATNVEIDSSNFTQHDAHYGGAICLMNYYNVIIDNCRFAHNSVFQETDGSTAGAIYAELGQIFRLKNSYFNNNMAVAAGAVFLGNAYDTIIENCNFTSNYGLYYGGAINFNNNVLKLQVLSTSFTANYAFWGGALYMLTLEDAKFNSCYFQDNQAVSSGDEAGAGGVAYGSECYGVDFNSCDFIENYAKHIGGALAFTNSNKCNFNDCTFKECFAPNCGAAAVLEGSYTFNRCKFLDNWASEYVGALLGGTAVDCIFEGNSEPQTYQTEIINTNTQPDSNNNNNNNNKNPSGNTQKATKTTPKLVASKKTFKVKVKTKKYAVTLKNNAGKAIAGVKLTIKIKGKTYTAKTNSKGKATFKIKNLKKKGNYQATVKFGGNGQYNSVSKKVKITVKK